MSEVDRLWDRLHSQGVAHFHVSLAPGFAATAEDVARELNEVNEHLSDPRNNLIARLGGQAFLLEDSIRCTEGRVSAQTLEPVRLTAAERHQVRRDKEMLALVNEAIAMLSADGGLN